ncbi:hypothetical protein BGZ76_004285 [Entomortierella beljakovae]|nr:hypothetical protein BGZ76_004285 [Entomortierella beljakovae]
MRHSKEPQSLGTDYLEDDSNGTFPVNFISAFPELASLVCTPSELCPSCLATPPHTPPEVQSPSYHSTTTSTSSNTLCDTLSIERSNSAPSESSCLGQFSDYVCALDQGDLRRGVLYITNSHLCFSGGRSKVVISYDDIVSIEPFEDMFSTSISIRVRHYEPPSSYSSSQLSQMATEVTPSRNSYVFTNFVNCDQAQAEIEKCWMANDSSRRNISRRVKNNQLTTTTSSSSNCNFSLREKTGQLLQDSRTRTKRRLTRAQSMVEGNVGSQLGIITKLESYVRPLVSRTSSADDDADADMEEESLFNVIYPINESHPRSKDPFENRRVEDDSTADLYGSTRNVETSFPQGLAAPIPIQISSASSSSSIRGYKLKSPTPPPSLLSPSLTTTKVSRSSSTVHGSVGQGTKPGMVVHVRTESEGSKFDPTSNLIQSNNHTGNDPLPTISRSTSPSLSYTTLASIGSEIIQEFSAPIMCGCDHYKNAVLSTIVPMPLETCFEILFSAQKAGQGDSLTCEANRVVNGSADVGVTAWETKESDSSEVSNEWENKERCLEYSVLFRVPMLAKTSALCFETQQILQHNANVIRIHSEQRTPNIPFGEQFTCVSQICLTRDSPGNTRIKCHSETKFKKSIMLSGKIEAASLEVSSGFYRELIRQLVEVAESRDMPIIVRRATATSIQNHPDMSSHSQSTISEAPASSKMDDIINESLGVTASSRTLISRSPPGVSAAQSLLSQQYLKNPPTISRRRKDSTFSSSPPSESAISTSNPIKTATIGQTGHDSTTNNEETSPSGESNGKAIKSTNTGAAADIWNGFMKKSMALFNISSSTPKSIESSSSSDKNSGDQIEDSDKSTTTSMIVDGGLESTDGSSADLKVDTSAGNVAETISKSSDKTATSSLEKSDRQQGSVSRIVLWAFAFGLMISILNAWRLVNTVSSVAQIMQSKSKLESEASAHTQHGSFANSMISKHLKQQAYLVPLQIQTEMLRAEIMELMELLEAQKKIRETYIEPEIQNSKLIVFKQRSAGSSVAFLHRSDQHLGISEYTVLAPSKATVIDLPSAPRHSITEFNSKFDVAEFREEARKSRKRIRDDDNTLTSEKCRDIVMMGSRISDAITSIAKRKKFKKVTALDEKRNQVQRIFASPSRMPRNTVNTAVDLARDSLSLTTNFTTHDFQHKHGPDKDNINVWDEVQKSNFSLAWAEASYTVEIDEQLSSIEKKPEHKTSVPEAITGTIFELSALTQKSILMIAGGHLYDENLGSDPSSPQDFDIKCILLKNYTLPTEDHLETSQDNPKSQEDDIALLLSQDHLQFLNTLFLGPRGSHQGSELNGDQELESINSTVQTPTKQEEHKI